MQEGRAGRLGLGGIEQVGYVVESIDASLPAYEALYGSFQVFEAAMDGVLFRGQEICCKLKIATNNDGPIEIELIEVLEGETPHTEHLRAHGEGPHHVRFRSRAIEEKIAELEAEGYRNIFFKRFSPDTAFAYLEAPASMGASIVELFERP